MEPTAKLLKIVKHHEGLHDGNLTVIGLQPKMDPRGIWTEGYGRAMRLPDGRFIKGKENKAYAESHATINTEEEAIKAFFEDIKPVADFVNHIISKYKLSVSQDMFDALCDLVYNAGDTTLEKAGSPQKVLRAIISGSMSEIEAAFKLWVHGDGKVLPGLVARRLSEIHLIKTSEVKFFN